MYTEIMEPLYSLRIEIFGVINFFCATLTIHLIQKTIANI
jgi:hypothetical protein